MTPERQEEVPNAVPRKSRPSGWNVAAVLLFLLAVGLYGAAFVLPVLKLNRSSVTGWQVAEQCLVKAADGGPPTTNALWFFFGINVPFWVAFLAWVLGWRRVAGSLAVLGVSVFLALGGSELVQNWRRFVAAWGQCQGAWAAFGSLLVLAVAGFLPRSPAGGSAQGSDSEE
jgi:hypothetical protein